MQKNRTNSTSFCNTVPVPFAVLRSGFGATLGIAPHDRSHAIPRIGGPELLAWPPLRIIAVKARFNFACNLCGHLQRCQSEMQKHPKNSRKTAEKGAEWVAVKQPKKKRKNTRKTDVSTVFRVFWLFFRLFFGCFIVTHSAPFSDVFRLFSMSGFGTSVDGRRDCNLGL